MTHALIPLEPTLEMQHAYFAVIDKNSARVATDPRFGRYANHAAAAYKAMVAAAPKAPTTTGVNERLLEAAKAFIAKVDDLTPDINGIFQMAAIHGAKWPADKNWAQERLALIEALATASEGWVDEAEVLNMLDGVAISDAPPPLHRRGRGMALCYIFDIDGTVADLSHRLHHIQGDAKDWNAFFDACALDQPITHMVEIAQMLERKRPTLFVSGRSDRTRDKTHHWLFHHGLLRMMWALHPERTRLFMRADGDHRPDNIVKSELLDRILELGWNPIMVFEDRAQVVKMWRERGIPCAQIADGDF